MPWSRFPKICETVRQPGQFQGTSATFTKRHLYDENGDRIDEDMCPH
jgi:hypothetical protein